MCPVLAEGQVQSLIQGSGSWGDSPSTGQIKEVSLQTCRAEHCCWSLLIYCPVGIMGFQGFGYHVMSLGSGSGVQPWVLSGSSSLFYLSTRHFLLCSLHSSFPSFIYLFTCIYMGIHISVSAWRSEDNFQASVLPYLMDPEVCTQVLEFGPFASSLSTTTHKSWRQYWLL